MTENLPANITDEYCLKEFGWTKSRFQVVQRTYFKGMTIDDIAIFAHVCKHVGLDPFLKQIYPVIRDTKQKDGTKKPTMSIQTGIDGYRAIAERTGKYSPGKEPLFKYDKDARLFSATAYVMKMTNDGKWHEVAATAILSEYRPAFQNDFWGTKPHIMISKCAEALALRKAFPAELSGVYTKEEMDQADKEDVPLPQAECEEINHGVLSLPEENNQNQINITPEVEQESRISEDQLREILDGMCNVDETFLSNYKSYMQSQWGVSVYQHLPLKAYKPTMTAIKRIFGNFGSNASPCGFFIFLNISA